MVLYIHYGSTKFKPRYFEQVANQAELRVKPHGGLWASRIGAELGWREWCRYEDFRVECLSTYFCFRVTPAARVFHLYTNKDLDRLPHRNDCFDRREFYPDFEQMMKDGWDAIELHLSSTDKNFKRDGLYYRLYGWDCDSILIMNPKVISPLRI